MLGKAKPENANQFISFNILPLVRQHWAHTHTVLVTQTIQNLNHTLRAPLRNIIILRTTFLSLILIIISIREGVREKVEKNFNENMCATKGEYENTIKQFGT